MPRINLCPNPSAKNNLTGWGGGATRVTGLTGMTRTTGVQIPGNSFTLITAAAGTAAAGESWTVSIEARVVANGDVEIKLEWLDSTGTLISSVSDTDSLTAGTPARLSVGGTAPASTDRVQLVVTTFTTGTPTVDLAAALIEESASAGTYFDGDTAGASWDGADGNSTSTLADGLVVAARTSGRTTGGATTSHPATLPAGIQAGVDRLVVIYSCDSGPTLTADAASAARGWAKVAGVEPGSVVGSAIFEKLASGDDALTVTSSFNEESSHISLRVPGAAAPVATSTTGNGANSDPPSITPSGGAIPRLYVVALANEALRLPTVAPAGYANLLTQVAETASGASIATAERTATVATEDPGPWTCDAEDHVSWTIAMAAAGGTAHERAIVDAIGITDTAARTAAAARPLVDPVGLTDTASYLNGAAIVRDLVDTIGITDTAARTSAAARALVDPVGLTDTAARTTAAARALVDPVGLTDTASGSVGEGLPGVPWLTDVLGPAGRLIVEIAWGADLTAAPATWPWADVTTDVRQTSDITITIGRSDETSTAPPAECTLLLDNTSGDYSLGGQSRLWPLVRRNTPVRVRIDAGAGVTTVFQGFSDGFTPAWNITGSDASVRLSASGVTRRLMQGAAPVLSPIRRALTSSSSVVAYWPAEDGRAADYVSVAVGPQPMTITGVAGPKFGADDDTFVCSAALPTLRNSAFSGVVPTYTSPTNAHQVRMLIAFPDTEAPDQTVILRVFTTGTAVRWDLRFRTNGALSLHAFDRDDVELATSGAIAFGVNGVALRLSLELVQDGGDVDWRFGTITPDALFAFYQAGTLAGQTCGIVTRVEVNPTGALAGDTVVGHISVENVQTSQYDVRAQLIGNAGDLTTAGGGRLARLCAENDLPLTIYGTGGSLSSPADRMGPQRVAPLLELLRECETADQGVLWDGRDAGISYTTRRRREAGTVLVTVDAGDYELGVPFVPVDDDQRTRNLVTANRVAGGSATHQDVTGPLGTAQIGTYDSSVQVNTETDLALPLYAAWLVHLGTRPGYRYPQLTVDLVAAPSLAVGWLAVIPGARVDVVDLDAIRSQVTPGAAVPLIVEGYTMTIRGHEWTVTANCSPYEPWNVITLAADTGDNAPAVLHLDTDGSTLAAAAAAGATSISVATTSGPLWTTIADDYPLVLDVGGIPVRVTACSDPTSPQTMTVDPLPVARAAGAPVTVRDPAVLGL